MKKRRLRATERDKWLRNPKIRRKDNRQREELIMDVVDSKSLFNTAPPVKLWGSALGFEVEATLSVRGSEC